MPAAIRTKTLKFIARFDNNSTEYAKLKALTTGTAVTLTYDAQQGRGWSNKYTTLTSEDRWMALFGFSVVIELVRVG